MRSEKRKGIRRVLIAAATSAFIIAGCTPLSSPPSSEEPSPGEMPEQEFHNSTIHFYQSDVLSAKLQAGRIRKYTKRSTVLLDSSVTMEFYDSTGRRTTTLTSDSGRADESRKDMVAMGHVVALSDSGQSLETDQLRWENRTRRILSESRVHLTTTTDTIDGVGFSSDEHLKNWQILHPTGTTSREFERRDSRPLLSLPDSARHDSA